MQDKNLYLVDKDYVICDLGFAETSERCLIISVYDLANNQKLLNAMKLETLYVNTEKSLTFFVHYLAAFTMDRETSIVQKVEKLLTNPNVKIIFTNEKLLAEVKTFINF